jgi:hypothetical protein
MAAEEASSAGGIWFSVIIWEGIEGEVCMGCMSSWTSRSNIRDEEGRTICNGGCDRTSEERLL